MDPELYREMRGVEDHHWWFRGRRQIMWSLIDQVGARCERVLDVGCGTGRNLLEFGSANGAKGIDPSPVAVECCRERGLRVLQASCEQLPFEDASFDLILAADVLEHVADDGPALRELRRVSSETGHLLITAPAYTWMWSGHDVIHHHRRRYTLRRLRSRVVAAGWRPVAETYFNFLLLPAIASVRSLRRLSRAPARSDIALTPQALNGILEQPLRAEAALVARGVRLPAGVSIGMVCAPQGAP